MSWKYTRQKGQAFSVAALVSDLAKIQASLKANPSTHYSHEEPTSESADSSNSSHLSNHHSNLSKDDKDSNVAAILPLAKSSNHRRSVIIMGDVPKVVPVYTSLATLYKKSHEAESEDHTQDLHLREQYDKKIKNSILRTRSPNNVHGKKGVSVQPLQDDDKRLRLAFGASQFGIYLMPENVDSPIESLKARPAVTL